MSQRTLIGGLQAVQSALRYDPTRAIEAWVDRRRRDARLVKLREQLEGAGCPVQESDAKALARLLPDVSHQGVVLAYQGASPRGDADLAAHLDRLSHAPFLLILDQVQDPHNLGACLRTADAAGVDAVIAPRDRAVGLTPVVHRVAAGAAEAMPFYQVTNLARCLRGLKDRGIWLMGAADEAAEPLSRANFTGPLALALGAEGKGLRRLTREHCDTLVAIPMAGHVESLNVSVAAGVLLFEAVRQRSAFMAAPG
ncbi:MAG: 23S rRNA (guanosine(2251)-2'-O)-methyltransferase RlmB [Spiribacter salinus]|uniref:23S rRNA (guanosine-2'-O-)-methyltransferase RlmB n=1 Tax=Spiribacter salinus TaxID=1335746 RepID=A0A540VVZ7_9GAMM|nr:MAG: 23S rRNA (guanosine(2251)-2'-O)-methyltransferase RlmB [Spiribacter salinus]